MSICYEFICSSSYMQYFQHQSLNLSVPADEIQKNNLSLLF